MELFEFQNGIAALNKQIKRLKAEYGVDLNESSIQSLISKTKRKVRVLYDLNENIATNDDWVRETFILKTAEHVQRVLQENTNYRVDPKTGALLNITPKSASGDVSERPDLYWRNGDESTDSTVIPMPLDQHEINQSKYKEQKSTTPKSTGMYVSATNTPGAEDTVVNAIKGDKVVKNRIRKDGTVVSKTVDRGASVASAYEDTKPYIIPELTSDQKKNKEIKMEGTAKNRLLMLTESEIEKAQIVMAVQSEIVEKLQRDAEKTANMKIDVLGPIIERIKAEHGLDAAEAFRDTITRLIDQALDVIMQVKDEIHTETLKLTGDVSSAPSLEQDLGGDELVPEMGVEDEFAEDPALDAGLDPVVSDDLGEPLPVDREVKESAQPRRIGIVVEGKAGSIGKKHFNSPKEMKQWVMENKSKIKKIHKLIK